MGFVLQLAEVNTLLDLARKMSKTKRLKAAARCLLCNSKSHEEGECANTNQQRSRTAVNGMINIMGKPCITWVRLLKKDLVTAAGANSNTNSKKRKR